MKIVRYKNCEALIKQHIIHRPFSGNTIKMIFCISLAIVTMSSFGVLKANGETINQEIDNSTLVTDNNTKVSAGGSTKIATSGFVYSIANNRSNDVNKQYAIILPSRNDGSIYSGIITFTSNQPVKMQILHSFKFENLSIYNKQLKDMISRLYNFPNASSLISPDYTATSSDQFSASISFAGEGVEFLSEKPFVTVYTLAVALEKRANITGPTKNETEVSAFETPGIYKVTSGSLLIEVIPYLPNELLQELPFSNLSSADVSTILKKIPIDKGSIILDKIPADKRQEILDKIPADKRQEMLKNG